MASLKVTCPECGSTETITLNLNACDEARCDGCGEDFSPASAVKAFQQKAAQWELVVEMIAFATKTRTQLKQTA